MPVELMVSFVAVWGCVLSLVRDYLLALAVLALVTFMCAAGWEDADFTAAILIAWFGGYTCLMLSFCWRVE